MPTGTWSHRRGRGPGPDVCGPLSLQVTAQVLEQPRHILQRPAVSLWPVCPLPDAGPGFSQLQLGWGPRGISLWAGGHSSCTQRACPGTCPWRMLWLPSPVPKRLWLQGPWAVRSCEAGAAWGSPGAPGPYPGSALPFWLRGPGSELVGRSQCFPARLECSSLGAVSWLKGCPQSAGQSTRAPCRLLQRLERPARDSDAACYSTHTPTDGERPRLRPVRRRLPVAGAQGQGAGGHACQRRGSASTVLPGPLGLLTGPLGSGWRGPLSAFPPQGPKGPPCPGSPFRACTLS